MVWEEMGKAIIKLDKNYPKVWRLSEQQMLEWVMPNKTLCQLRSVFWSWVYECRMHNAPVRQTDVFGGMVSKRTWHRLLENEANLAYLVRPIPRVEAALEDLMWKGLRKIHEMMESPVDYQKMSAGDRRLQMSMVFAAVQEVERMLNPLENPINNRRQEYRKKFLADLEKKDPDFNIEEPESPSVLDTFELEELPPESIWIEGEEDGSNPGDESDTLTEEGSSGGDEEEKTF